MTDPVPRLKYEIAYGQDVEQLSNAVNMYLAKGFKLHGGVFLDNSWLCQALVKELTYE